MITEKEEEKNFLREMVNRLIPSDCITSPDKALFIFRRVSCEQKIYFLKSRSSNFVLCSILAFKVRTSMQRHESRLLALRLRRASVIDLPSILFYF